MRNLPRLNSSQYIKTNTKTKTDTNIKTKTKANFDVGDKVYD